MEKQRLRKYTLLILLSVIWGLAFVAIRQADFELSAVNLTLLRWVIVTAVFLALYPFIGKPKTKFEVRDLPRLLVVAVASVALYHLSLNYAEKTVSASLSGLLISLAPMFGVLLSSLTLHERVGRRLLSALALALVGVIVISLPSLDAGFLSILGPMAVVVSAFANGVFVAASKPLVTKYGPFPVAIWGAALGTALILPLASGSLIQEASSLSQVGWLSVLYLALLSTVVANLILYTLVGRQSVSTLSVQLYLIPLVSVVGGVVLLGETVSVLTLAGGALLLVAVAVATSAKR